MQVYYIGQTSEFESVPGFLTGSIIAAAWFCLGETIGTLHSGRKFDIYQCQMAILHVQLPCFLKHVLQKPFLGTLW